MTRAAGLKAKAAQALAGLDDVVNKGLQDLNIPGVAVAVVAEDEAVLAKGYGFKDVEKKLPMTPDTLLAIGSSTKAFTVFTLGTLVDEGKLDMFNGLKAADPVFEDSKLSFISDAKGNVARLEVPFEPTLDPIVFDKKPDARLSDPAYLQKFVGKYVLVEQVITISLKGNVLTASIPGAPEMELVPMLGDEFTLKQMKVIGLRFKTDEKGNVTAIELSQPSGIFEAKRQEK